VGVGGGAETLLPVARKPCTPAYCSHLQTLAIGTLCLSKMITKVRTYLGEFKGKNGDGVVQYLGIKFASVKDQLSGPEMMLDYGFDNVDATEFGWAHV
jgi:hypothetical protein